MQVWSLGQEDPLEYKMATHSSILAWKTPWPEEPGGLQFMVWGTVRHNWARKHQVQCPYFAFPFPLLLYPHHGTALRRAAWRKGLGTSVLVTLTKCLSPTRPSESHHSPVADTSGRGAPFLAAQLQKHPCFLCDSSTLSTNFSCRGHHEVPSFFSRFLTLLIKGAPGNRLWSSLLPRPRGQSLLQGRALRAGPWGKPEGHEHPAQHRLWARAGEPRPHAEWTDAGPARGSGLDHAPSYGWGSAGQTASSLGAANMWASVNLCVNK